ncbi:hypothetical protein GV827_08470 [Sulfitobacter sp. JBTF-M27]|uniref:SnoaL-like domain-containing protein n=1 Tax=Sulfitobacter sediminilitoris TaxID=2698830 RepID=A0A6P0CD77_9RHOB|nr:hypothetical protein [Sulfitobacter sediminilitoris]NEK22433.1 hypothetical protein [Sulfitobacter sediminilitoris]
MTSDVSSNAQAKDFYQDLLDRLSSAYEADDFDAYAQMIRVPHEASSYGPKVQVNTMGELRVLFDSIRWHFAKTGVTDYVRTCISAEFLSATEIVGTHETRMLAGTQVVETPYPVKSYLQLIDGNWWVCKSDNAVQPDNGFGRVLSQNARGTDGRSDPDPN